MASDVSRRQAVRGGTALVAGLLVGGCRDEQPAGQTLEQPTVPPRQPTIEPREVSPDGGFTGPDLKVLLDRRAQAVLDRDEQAFLADLDHAHQELVEQEKLLFANLRQFEFSDYRFVTERAYIRPPEPGSTDAYRVSPVISVEQLVVDTGPGGVAPAGSYRYEVEDRDGRPVVVGIDAIARADADQFTRPPGVYANAPWNLTPLTVLQAGNVWLAGDASVPDLDRYAAAAEAEAGSVEALWGDRIGSPGYVLFFTRDENNFRTWYELEGGRDADKLRQLEGITIWVLGVRAGGDVYTGQYAGSRIVVNLANTELIGDEPRSVLRHELAHAVTARAASVPSELFALGAPNWALEGFAHWVENLDSPERQAVSRAVVADGVRAGRFTGLPPATTDWSSSDVVFNYAVSGTLFTFIDLTWGQDTAVEFYARVIQHQDTELYQVIDLPEFDDICLEVLGTGSGAFLQQWAGFVRGGA